MVVVAEAQTYFAVRYFDEDRHHNRQIEKNCRLFDSEKLRLCTGCFSMSEKFLNLDIHVNYLDPPLYCKISILTC